MASLSLTLRATFTRPSVHRPNLERFNSATSAQHRACPIRRLKLLVVRRVPESGAGPSPLLTSTSTASMEPSTNQRDFNNSRSGSRTHAKSRDSVDKRMASPQSAAPHAPAFQSAMTSSATSQAPSAAHVGNGSKRPADTTDGTEYDLLLEGMTDESSGYDSVEKLATLSIGEVQAPDESPSTQWFSWRTLWAYAGPGWLMSIAYVDPGNLESDLQAGAYAGYQLIWVLFASTVMGFYLQVLAARLGVVTGRNLAEMCTKVYPRWASLVLWVMTEIAIVGSDIQEVLGSAIAFQILFNFPLWLGCLITGLDTFTFLLLHRYGIRKLEAFFVSLIGVMLVCFVANFVRGEIAARDIAGGFIPEVQPYAVTQAVGILGAVIMPHNIFLHSALVQTRKVDHNNLRKVKEANKYFAIESGGALFVSFLINLAVLAVFAKGFFSPDCTASFEASGVNSACVPGGNADGPTFGACTLSNGKTGMCQGIGLSQAGDALSDMLGGYAEIIWAIGLLAAGQSSTMTGTYAGQFVMEGFLNLRLSPWKRVALTRCVALVPAMAVAILSEQHPQDSDRMDEFLNVLQSIQLPFALLPVLVFTSSKRIMGEFANSKRSIIVGWLLGAVVCIINLYLVVVNLSGMDLSIFTIALVVFVGCAYFWFLGYLVRSDVLIFCRWVKDSLV